MSEANAVANDEMRYGFGRNWAEFIDKNFSEERIQIAQNHLLKFLKLPDLRDKSFLDIGCGSGMHSLGVCRSGAANIAAFDYDADSVATTTRLWEWAGRPKHWSVTRGSVLDREFMDTLGRHDVVYSWGVLHHTGEMWRAIENAASRMNDDGVLYIALYTKDVYLNPSCDYWLDVKRSYNRAGPRQRRWMEGAYAWRFTIWPALRAGRNPLGQILGYSASRGMSYWTDVKDWLGGWPMEFAGIAETQAFCVQKLGLELLNISAGEANTEYLFRRCGARNYWDGIMARHRFEPLRGPFSRKGGHAWVAKLEHHAQAADTAEQPRRSRLMLFENGVPLGFAHCAHADIEAHGGSRYSHWHDNLIFSTPDGSDPNRNDREYTVCADFM